MQKRFLTIWFRHLKTDWLSIRRPALLPIPFVLAAPDHGRMVITAVNSLAFQKGIRPGQVVADTRAIYPGLDVIDDKPGLADKILKSFTGFCYRYTPIVAVDPPDGLILDITGCAHLWGGEKQYVTEITMRFKGFGYTVRTGLADTIGAAWAISRFGNEPLIIASGHQQEALLNLPPASLRPEPDIPGRLYKLGLYTIKNFIRMPPSVLKRRFGQHFITRLNQALGREEEAIIPVQPLIPFQERLPCLEPIATATGITIALQRLLERLCNRLQQEQMGLRQACFTCYRLDGGIEKIEIGTNRASRLASHLFKLFDLKIPGLQPGLGIELFILEAPRVEELTPLQEQLWDSEKEINDIRFSGLLDRVAGKIGAHTIRRYIPDEHYWPERSIRLASSLQETGSSSWPTGKPRPVQLLTRPEPVDVTAPVPDYPPMLFRYKGRLHTIKKADGPERIEQEWWLQEGQHRDYYCVEDQDGLRFWLFRSGHYEKDKKFKWFLHGLFA